MRAYKKSLMRAAPKSANPQKIAVVIPAYKVARQLEAVLTAIPDFVDAIYVVDDCCPEDSGAVAERLKPQDPRITLIRHAENQGVGGAMLSGYQRALDDGCHIIVKIDGDGQMNPELLKDFVLPIVRGEADYTKGNRFHTLDFLSIMPRRRLLGNLILSFMTKMSSGYWSVFDPTNGYTCISSAALRLIPFDKMSRRYFFESDMLFRLNIVRAVVADVPMDALYADEQSSLRVRHNIIPFFKGHCRNFYKRIVYNYFLRNFSVASLQLLMGMTLLFFGLIFGLYHWADSSYTGIPATSGTVMIAALSILVGIQMLLGFVNYDVANQPDKPLSQMESGE